MITRSRPTERAILQLLTAAAMLVLAAGCSGDSGESSSASPKATEPFGSSPSARSESEPPSVEIDFETCADFGPADAAALLGIPEEEIEPSSTVEDWGTTCTFVRRGDALYEDAVSFTLSRSSSEEEAAREMEELRGHVEVGDQVLGSGQFHLVPDLGDEALWVAANDSLYVRAGTVSIIVTLPNDETRQIEVARALLD